MVLSGTVILYIFAMISVFYIGYLIGRVQKLEYCDRIQPHSMTNSISVQYVTESIVPDVIRCPPGTTAAGEPNGPSEAPPPVISTASIECEFSPVTPVYLHKRKGITQDLMFNYVNHASQPTKGDVIITHHKQKLPYKGDGLLTGEESDPFTHCREVYLTRTGSRESPKPKCGKCHLYSITRVFLFLFVFLILFGFVIYCYSRNYAHRK
mgnify:FL=1